MGTIGADDQSGTMTRERAQVVWGCREHATPRGTVCEHCANQGELFPRAEVGRPARRQGGRSAEAGAGER